MNANNGDDNILSFEDLKKIIERYTTLVESGVNERWDLFDIDLSKINFFNVLGGLIARQANLTISFSHNPGVWSPHISPLVYRAQTDVYITLAWILEDDCNNRADQYISYGLGQEKLQIAHLRAEVDRSGRDSMISDFIENREDWLNSQLYEELAEVDLGHWAGSNARKMAEDVGCMDLYHCAYQSFSAGTHSTWPHIGRHDSRICNNPLHKGHRVPHVHYESVNDLYPLVVSAKYMQKTFVLIDTKMKIKCNIEKPMDYILSESGFASKK